MATKLMEMAATAIVRLSLGGLARPIRKDTPSVLQFVVTDSSLAQNLAMMAILLTTMDAIASARRSQDGLVMELLQSAVLSVEINKSKVASNVMMEIHSVTMAAHQPARKNLDGIVKLILEDALIVNQFVETLFWLAKKHAMMEISLAMTGKK